MRAAVLEEARKFVIREVPEPVPDKDEALLKVRYCGICGSDLHLYKHGMKRRILGHEVSGDIVELGSDVEEWRVGDRVTIDPHTICYNCYWCKIGKTELCERPGVTGVDRDGGFATYVKVKSHQLHKLPDELTYEQGTLIEPLSVVLHGVRLSEIKVGDTVAVLGLGPLGQLAARLAKASGAKAVYAADVNKSRIDLARNVVDEAINSNEVDSTERILELTNDMGPDIVFECSGNVAASQQSITLPKRGGTLVVIGICFEPIEVSPFLDLVFKQLTIKGSFHSSLSDFVQALDIIKSKTIEVDSLITSKIPLEDIEEKGFEAALGAEGGKILVRP